MQHEYFVSFARIATSGSGFGFSHATVTLDQPMTADAITQLTESFAEQSPGYSVTILSFQQLEAPKPSTSSV
jgi:hypothetical protein